MPWNEALLLELLTFAVVFNNIFIALTFNLRSYLGTVSNIINKLSKDCLMHFLCKNSINFCLICCMVIAKGRFGNFTRVKRSVAEDSLFFYNFSSTQFTLMRQSDLSKAERKRYYNKKNL